MIAKLQEAQKILTINFGGIGDEVLFLPTLRKLRQLYPKGHITLMVEPRSRSIEQITDLIDETITFDIKKRPLFIGDLLQVVSMIRDGSYDLVLSSGGSPLVSMLLFMGGPAWRIGYDSGPMARRLLTHAVPLNKDQYAGAMYMDLATYLGKSVSASSVTDAASNAGSAIGATASMAAASNASVAAGAALPAIPEIKVSPESITRMRDFLATRSTKGDAGQKLVLLHPGTSKLAIEKGIIKTWDTKNWCELIRLLQADSTCVPILVGGPDDQSIIQEINAIMAPNEPPFISAVGHTKSLADLAALTKLCDLLVCVDSAPMHIAVGTGTPVVAMFGPTDENKLLPKNPCFKALRDPTASTPTLAVRGVQLPPHDVYRSVLDQLKVSTNQENCQELHR